MSNSASIAAAKRRRGATQNPQVATNSSKVQNRNINKVQGEPTLDNNEGMKKVSPLQILGSHENRIEFLEKQHNNIAMALNKYPNPNEEKIVTLKDLEDFRDAFKNLSSSLEKKSGDSNINLEQIKEEVSEEFNKKQLTNLATKEDVDEIVGLLRKELLNDNFKTLENKINNLKISNSEVSSLKDIKELTKKVTTEVTKGITKEIETNISKNAVNKKQLDDVKNELVKLVNDTKIANNDYTTHKDLAHLKKEITDKIDSLQTNNNVEKSNISQEEKLTLTSKVRIDTLENKVKALEAIVLK
jgi:hypothetical protein